MAKAKFKNPVKLMVEVKFEGIKIIKKFDLNSEVLGYKYESRRFLLDAICRVADQINIDFLKEHDARNKEN